MAKYSHIAFLFIAMTFWFSVGSYNIYTIQHNRFSPPEVDDAYNLLLKSKISKNIQEVSNSPALTSLYDQLTTTPEDRNSKSARWRERVYYRVFHQYNLAWNRILNFFYNENIPQDIEAAYYRAMYVGLFIFGLGIYFFMANMLSPLAAMILLSTIVCTVPLEYGFFWMNPQNFCIGICLFMYGIFLVHNKLLLWFVPLFSLFACFLHHSALIFLVPSLPALYISARSAYNHSWKCFHIYLEDLITLSVLCIFVYFTYIKLIDPLPYLRELNFADSLSFTDKLSFVSNSLGWFSHNFFIFLDNFIPPAFLPNLENSKKFAFLLLVLSFIWSLYLFRKNIIQILLVISIYSGVAISLVYHPPLAPYAPVNRLFTGWIVLQYAIFIQFCIFICKILIRNSSHPFAVRTILCVLAFCLIIRIVIYQMPRWDAYRNYVIERHSNFFYDAAIISKFLSLPQENSFIGYAYETDLYTSLLYGNLLHPTNFIYITNENDLKNKYSADNLSYLVATNTVARICSPRVHVSLSYNFTSGKYILIFDNVLQKNVFVNILYSDFHKILKIPPHIKQYRVVLDLAHPVEHISLSTDKDFVIIRGFILHPDQKTFWPWGENFLLTSQSQGKPSVNFNFKDKYLPFGPDLREWHVYDDSTGLILFHR